MNTVIIEIVLGPNHSYDDVNDLLTDVKFEYDLESVEFVGLSGDDYLVRITGIDELIENALENHAVAEYPADVRLCCDLFDQTARFHNTMCVR